MCLGAEKALGEASIRGKRFAPFGMFVLVAPGSPFPDPFYRNIDRILNNSAPSSNGMLSYKEHGLLLCEVHVLRQKALQVLPGEINHEFLEEVGDLVDIRTGVVRQQKVVERIRWAYSKWLH